MWLPMILVSAFCWSWVNVLDSAIVRQHEKHPLVLLWFQSLFTVPTLFILLFFVDVHTTWWPLLVLGGLVTYLGDIFFFLILDRVDASISNAAWSILAIFLSIIGFIFFHESWSLQQFLGAVLILGAVFFLTFWHSHILSFKTLLLLIAFSLFYLPTHVLRKAALLDSQQIGAVFFWLLIGRELLSFAGALIVPSLRKRTFQLFRRAPPHFFIGSGLVIVAFFFGEYFGTLAYNYGPVSLVSIVANS